MKIIFLLFLAMVMGLKSPDLRDVKDAVLENNDQRLILTTPEDKTITVELLTAYVWVTEKDQQPISYVWETTTIDIQDYNLVIRKHPRAPDNNPLYQEPEIQWKFKLVENVEVNYQKYQTFQNKHTELKNSWIEKWNGKLSNDRLIRAEFIPKNQAMGPLPKNSPTPSVKSPLTSSDEPITPQGTSNQNKKKRTKVNKLKL
jgi:hypothetical protein